MNKILVLSSVLAVIKLSSGLSLPLEDTKKIRFNEISTTPNYECVRHHDIFDSEGKYLKTACAQFESKNHEEACVGQGMKLFVVDSSAAHENVLNFATSIFGSHGSSILRINGKQDVDGKWFTYDPTKKPLMRGIKGITDEEVSQKSRSKRALGLLLRIPVAPSKQSERWESDEDDWETSGESYTEGPESFERETTTEKIIVKKESDEKFVDSYEDYYEDFVQSRMYPQSKPKEDSEKPENLVLASTTEKNEVENSEEESDEVIEENFGDDGFDSEEDSEWLFPTTKKTEAKKGDDSYEDYYEDFVQSRRQPETMPKFFQPECLILDAFGRFKVSAWDCDSQTYSICEFKKNIPEVTTTPKTTTRTTTTTTVATTTEAEEVENELDDLITNEINVIGWY